MDKLIIQHGDRVTEHELGEGPLIVGRDPQCDLFFADRKLSRRHARFERDGKGLRLVDLGSRNGSWVNDERIETRLVAPGESMRLGSLLISLSAESEPEEDSTLYLGTEPAGDESQTVLLSSEVPSARGGEPSQHAKEAVEDAADDESGTVLLSLEAPSEVAGEPSQHAKEVVEDAAADESGTVLLSLEAPSELAGEPSQHAKEAVEDAAVDESGTVLLSSEALSDLAADPRNADAANAETGDVGTVILPVTATLAPSVDHDEPSAAEEPTLHAVENVDNTVMLPHVTPPKYGETGEVIIRGTVDPSLGAATRVISAESLGDSLDETEPPRAGDGGPEPFEDAYDGASLPPQTVAPGRSSPGNLRFVGLVAAISVLAVAVLALPLMRTLGTAVTFESTLRGRALVDLLAATNMAARSQDPPEEWSLRRAIGEPGAVAAYVLDLSGDVVASEGGDAASLPANFIEEAVGLRSSASRDLAGGDVLMMAPMVGAGRRLGVVVLHYRPATATSWPMVMLVPGGLLFLMGVGVAVFLARRWALDPLRDLRDDVLALREGYVGTLPEERPYSELTELARSFNELLEERGGSRDDDASQSDLDPTLVRDG